MAMISPNAQKYQRPGICIITNDSKSTVTSVKISKNRKRFSKNIFIYHMGEIEVVLPLVLPSQRVLNS